MSGTKVAGPLYSASGFMGGNLLPKSGQLGAATIWYVNPGAGDGGGDGSDWDNAFTTMQAALNTAQSGDTICFIGNVREQCTPPINLFDITIIGCGNRPRNSDAVTGYYAKTSATWRGPASPTATTPLITVRNQGWRFQNILFNAPTDAAAVKLVRDAVADPNEQDASHAAFFGCRFVGGNMGIQDAGGCYNILIDDCEFFNITDGTAYAITNTSTAVANPLNWTVRNSRFRANDNHIVSPASGWYLYGNIFGPVTGTVYKIDFNNGVATNIITDNFLSGTYSIAGGYRGAGAGDEWYGNWASTSPTVSDPA